ncbi:hypothetical protein ACIQCQ_23960 [Streptomyces sp. NPDC088394]|uniref:hypothetical protein n=1 Tax=Streptomyces sp. NPDC088394 TaxID=3365860 RepID=UPI00380108C4
MKTEDQTVAADHNINPARRQETFEIAMGRIAGRFTRGCHRPDRGLGRFGKQ